MRFLDKPLPLPSNGDIAKGYDQLADKTPAVDFEKITRDLDAKAERIADLAGANSLERETIRKISKLVRHGHKCMDLTFRKDGQDYRFEADWVARLFRSHSGV